MSLAPQKAPPISEVWGRFWTFSRGQAKRRPAHDQAGYERRRQQAHVALGEVAAAEALEKRLEDTASH